MYPIIVICGPTASGKSAIAFSLAQKIGAVIINADSQQIYREIPILSAQPTQGEMQSVPHELYGVMNGDEVCTVAKWLELVTDKITNAKQPVLVVGGTGMYLNALFNGLSKVPEAPNEVRGRVRCMDLVEVAEKLGDKADGNNQRMRRALEVYLATGRHLSDWHKEPNDHIFSPEDFTISDISVSRGNLYDKINRRFDIMVENGAIGEVKNLVAQNYDKAAPIMKACGVPELSSYLQGGMSLEVALDKAKQMSRNYAKRQITWFKNQMPAHKVSISPDISEKDLLEILNLAK